MRNAVAYLALFALALAVRAPYLARSPNRATPPGTVECERAALSLARGDVLGHVFAEDSGPSAHLAPMYPCLLAGGYRFASWAGIDPRHAQEKLATLFTCAGICLLPPLARRARLQPGVGWAAAFLLALVPGSRHFETSGSYEQPLLLGGLSLVLLAYFRLREHGWGSRRQVVVTGLLMGVCTLLGPMFLGALGLMILSDFLVLREDRRAVLFGAMIFVVAMAVPLLPWAYRNYRVLGGWVWTRSNFGLELWVGNNPDATGQTYFPKFGQMHPFSSPREAREYKRVGELAYMRQKRDAALAWIAAHPSAFARLTAKRAAWYWFPRKSMVWWDGKRWVARFYCASTLGMLGGLVALFRAGHPYRWLFVSVLVGYSLPYLLTHVEGRYRYPLCGLCTVLACEFVARVSRWCWCSWTASRSRATDPDRHRRLAA